MNDVSQLDLRSDTLQEALDAINHAFVVFEAGERFVFCNLKYREWYAPIAHLLTRGRPVEEILRAWYGWVGAELIPPLTEDEYVARTLARHRSAAGVEVELRSRHRWIAVAEHRTPDGGTVALRRDITQLKKLEADLRDHQRVMHDIAELSYNWYWRQNVEFCYTEISGGVGLEVNFLLEAWHGRTPWELDLGGVTDEQWALHRALLERREPYFDFTFSVGGEGGQRRWLATSGKPLFDPDGNFQGYHGVGRDITARKMDELRLAQLARYDDLTGLANRHLLAERIQQAIALAQREGCHCAVLFIDLDRVRRVNNTWGHAAGDSLLTEIAMRIARRVRETDTVGRSGGDEFIVVLPMIPEPAAAAHVAQGILQAISEPLTMHHAQLHVTASIGISVFPDDGEDQQTLIQHADAAMYYTKAHGRNGYHFYASAMHDLVNTRLSLESSLRAAIKKKQFSLVYQPQVTMQGGAVVGVEALLRWNHPEQGVLLPGDFIDIAEETGLILRIGEWVLAEACREARKWPLAGADAPRVAVNISALQFQQPQLHELVKTVLAETGLPPHRLELEVTETSLMRDTADVLHVLDRLRASGVAIAIDDFGSGYSSLGYLKRFPIDKLKIDKTFIDGCADDGNDAAITTAIIALGHALNLTVVAEGVETDAQLDFLRSGGCDVVQGFLPSPPLPGAALRRFLRKMARQR
jgi:diguanylate cyclase (GGDEF)-like protein